MAHFTINMCWESLLIYSPHLLLELILHHFWTVLPRVTSKTLYESSKIHGFNEKTVCTWEYYSTLLALLVFMCVCVLLCVVVLSLSGDGWCYKGDDLKQRNVWCWCYWCYQEQIKHMSIQNTHHTCVMQLTGNISFSPQYTHYITVCLVLFFKCTVCGCSALV